MYIDFHALQERFQQHFSNSYHMEVSPQDISFRVHPQSDQLKVYVDVFEHEWSVGYVRDSDNEALFRDILSRLHDYEMDDGGTLLVLRKLEQLYQWYHRFQHWVFDQLGTSIDLEISDIPGTQDPRGFPDFELIIDVKPQAFRHAIAGFEYPSAQTLENLEDAFLAHIASANHITYGTLKYEGLPIAQVEQTNETPLMTEGNYQLLASCPETVKAYIQYALRTWPLIENNQFDDPVFQDESKYHDIVHSQNWAFEIGQDTLRIKVPLFQTENKLSWQKQP